MSYKMQLLKQQFEIKAEHHPAARKKLLKNGWGIVEDWRGKHVPKTLVELLSKIGFDTEVDEDSNIIAISWDSSGNGYNVDKFLLNIAEFVESGSKITFFDQYHTLILFTFQEKEMTIKTREVNIDEG